MCQQVSRVFIDSHGLLVMFVSRQHNFSNILMLLISYFVDTKRVLIATPELGLNFFGVYQYNSSLKTLVDEQAGQSMNSPACSRNQLIKPGHKNWDTLGVFFQDCQIFFVFPVDIHPLGLCLIQGGVSGFDPTVH